MIKGYDPFSPPVKKAAPSKPRTTKEKVDSDAIDMKAMVKAGTVNKLTVDVLKSWLKMKGIAVASKKKAALVDDVCSFF